MKFDFVQYIVQAGGGAESLAEPLFSIFWNVARPAIQIQAYMIERNTVQNLITFTTVYHPHVDKSVLQFAIAIKCISTTTIIWKLVMEVRRYRDIQCWRENTEPLSYFVYVFVTMTASQSSGFVKCYSCWLMDDNMDNTNTQATVWNLRKP